MQVLLSLTGSTFLDRDNFISGTAKLAIWVTREKRTRVSGLWWFFQCLTPFGLVYQFNLIYFYVCYQIF